MDFSIIMARLFIPVFSSPPTRLLFMGFSFILALTPTCAMQLAGHGYFPSALWIAAFNFSSLSCDSGISAYLAASSRSGAAAIKWAFPRTSASSLPRLYKAVTTSRWPKLPRGAKMTKARKQRKPYCHNNGNCVSLEPSHVQRLIYSFPPPRAFIHATHSLQSNGESKPMLRYSNGITGVFLNLCHLPQADDTRPGK